MSVPTLPLDFNKVRAAIAREIVRATGLDQNHVVYLEPEAPNQPRPTKPYFGFKFTSPAVKVGDDSKQNVKDANGFSTSIWNSGGQRRLSVGFDVYGNTHEEAYNYMGLWQTSLDLEDVQARLRDNGIAVWTTGNVADLSQLLNTGYEGRAHMDSFFGVAMNLQSDLGTMEVFEVEGRIKTDQGDIIQIETTVTGANIQPVITDEFGDVITTEEGSGLGG